MKRVPLIKMLAGTALALAVVSTPVIAGSSSSKDKKEALYPNATRKEPKLDLTSEKDQKAINDGLDAVNNQDKEKAIQILQPIADSSKSKYAQALALQGLANVHYNDGTVLGQKVTPLDRVGIYVPGGKAAYPSSAFRFSPVSRSSMVWCRLTLARCWPLAFSGRISARRSSTASSSACRRL